ncbi:MAG: type IV toxin-antitoxin system AbiEi family antitoxin domain-containing protein, partial [Gaiellaceae bacterium]
VDSRLSAHSLLNGAVASPQASRLPDMSLHPPLAATAIAQGGPFTTAQALAAGYEERELARLVRSKAWTRLRRGVLIESNHIPDDDAGRSIVMLRGLRLRARGPIIASHRTAAAIHHLATLDPSTDLLDVTRPGSGLGRVEAGVRWRSAALPASHLVRVAGVSCTAVARTVIDNVREADFAGGLVVAESALNLGLTTLPVLREVHEFCLDWRGARNAGCVVSFASPLSESPGETLARIAFAEQGLPDPEQQRYIRDAGGVIGRVDFLWKDQRTIGEFDGKVKYTNSDNRFSLYDEKRREDRLRDVGFEVVRFGWSDVLGRPEWVARQVRAAFVRGARSSRAS